MQLMCDAVTVFGSRHGLLWNPVAKRCEIIRFDRFNELPNFGLRAGVIIDGKEYVFPLCAEGEAFNLLDQRMTPCTMSLIGIEKHSGIKVRLTAVTPFRPRDAVFSTTPVLALRLTASKLAGNFRWEGKTLDLQDAEIFIEFTDIAVAESGPDSLDLSFSSTRSYPKDIKGEEWVNMWDAEHIPTPQRDRVVALQGRREGARFTQRVSFADEQPAGIDLAWCTYSEPVMEVQKQRCPFKYASRFANLDAVADWARKNPTALFDNAKRVDGIMKQNSLSQSTNHLLAQTLHSWLGDTWYAVRGDKDWYSVWEGDCYFHSTVDVEYTQTPFYLAVWPELLKLELDEWPEYSKDGALVTGERGAGSLFLSHDIGCFAGANGQCYPHEMEVEETTNYLILSYVYYKRTGDASTIKAHADTIKRYLAFVTACDSTGNGIPDLGVANTVDDASPAVQFGREQVYLAGKTLAAYVSGAELLELLGETKQAAEYSARAQQLRTLIEDKGWMGDHFATLLEKSGVLTDPWSGQVFECEEIPGWDASHIYTLNGIALLDMVGCDTGLDREKLTTDLRVATERCLREYGCVHSDFDNAELRAHESMAGLAGASIDPGWISMNMLRDIAAFYRGVDLRPLADRYWEWQVTTNTQEPKIFFETFNGNDLCFYPRGIAIWGYFDALAGLVIDKPAGVDTASRPFAQLKVPRLYDADWANGTSTIIATDAVKVK